MGLKETDNEAVERLRPFMTPEARLHGCAELTESETEFCLPGHARCFEMKGAY
jgi:hypothetical protein